MSLKAITLLLLLFSLIFTSGCGASANASGGEDVVIDEGYNTKHGELVIDDSAFNDKNIQISKTGELKDEGTRMLADSSKIETLVDGFGNKSETRSFPGHPRLRFVLVRTGVDKTRTVTVYGYGSDTKIVDELSEIALTASADEIADKAKLTVTFGVKRKPENFLKRSPSENESLQPLPSSQFPVRSSGVVSEQ